MGCLRSQVDLGCVALQYIQDAKRLGRLHLMPGAQTLDPK